VSDELVEVRHRIYHEPDFVANIDHLLCLQEMEIRQRNLLREDRLPGSPTSRRSSSGVARTRSATCPRPARCTTTSRAAASSSTTTAATGPSTNTHERYNPMAIEFLDAHNGRRLTVASPDVIRRPPTACGRPPSGEPCAPVRDLIAADDVDGAYAVAQHNVARVVGRAGMAVCGHKIG
jgi:hypothetical protein